jgi:tetratricopeptide (TPR) repeat protein
MLTRPVYASPEVERTFTRHYQIVPEGALFRLHPFGETPPVLTREFSFRPFPKDNVYFRLLRERYASAYVNQAVLLAQAGDFARCERFLRKALEVDPAHARARSYLDQLEHAERQ